MDTDARPGPHYIFAMSYPVLWKPRYCKRVLAGAIAGRARVLRYEIPCEDGSAIPADEVVPNHVHLFVSAPPRSWRSAGAVAARVRQPAGGLAAEAMGNGTT